MRRVLTNPSPRISIATFALVALYGLVVVASVPVYAYRWHLFLHVFGAILFIGNIVVTAAWMLVAERSREAAVLRFASRMLNRADLLFTGPGVLLLLLNGLALAAAGWGGWTGFWSVGWIVAALALLILSGSVWVLFLLRYQLTLVRLSREAGSPYGNLSPEFFRVLHRWYAWGSVATILPLVSLVLMVVKPTLW